MKHLVTVLAVFLLMGSQTLAQETIPEPEDIKEFPNWVVAQKPVICGPVKEVMDKVKEFGEESNFRLGRCRTEKCCHVLYK
jgi:hypothetical protein